MTSALQVETIKNSAGVAVIDTFPEIDFWQLDEDYTGGVGTIQPWTRVGLKASGISIGNMPIGSGMTCQDGVFSFPRKGLYKIDFVAILKVVTDQLTEGINFDVSRNGGSSFLAMYQTTIGSITSSAEYHTVSVSQFLNVTSTDDIKIRLRAIGVASDTVFMSANSSESEHVAGNVETTILFNKVGPMVSS